LSLKLIGSRAPRRAAASRLMLLVSARRHVRPRPFVVATHVSGSVISALKVDPVSPATASIAAWIPRA